MTTSQLADEEDTDKNPTDPDDVIEGIKDIDEGWTVDCEGLDEALNL